MVVMDATDMRKLSREARHERRVQVIRLRKAGRTYDEIAAQTGLSRTGVFDICKRHDAAGPKALRDAPTGRQCGDGRVLDAEQEALVRKLITDKTPDQLKMPYALWTRPAVAQLIEQRFGIRLAVRTMGLYLARWGFTPQKPIKKAYEQSPAAVKKWLEEDYHRKPHSSLENSMTPLDKFMSQASSLKMVSDPDYLNSLFLVRAVRKVHHDGTISVNNRLYEVPARFIGTKVEIRFDNDDIFIYEDGSCVAKAKPVIFSDNAFAKRESKISFVVAGGIDDV